MNLQNRIVLVALGLLVWILGSVYYANIGPRILETTKLHYWVNFWLSPVLSTILVLVIFRLLHVTPSSWASAALLIAIPGMIGEAVVLSHLSTFMPRIQESSGGRYGAFLFATYATVLGIAEFVTWKAT
jgi:uncharacterized membrane protein